MLSIYDINQVGKNFP